MNLGGDDGFTLLELLVAVTVLLVGALAAIGAFDSARRLSTVAERQTTMAHRAQQELELITSLPYSQVALTAVPATAASKPNPGFYVSAPAGACPASPAGAPPTYRPDHLPGGSAAVEPLVINGCSYGSSALSGGTVTPSTPWSDGGLSGTVYAYVTYAADTNCSAGTVCPASNDYKRVSVVVTINGVAQPTAPALVSTVVADPSAIPSGAPANSQQNPLQSPSTLCTNGGGQTVQCNNALSGVPVTYFFSDTPWSGTYGPPSGGGNNLHRTLLSTLNGPGSPDQLISSPPTGSNTPPPCYALDIGCQATPGIPLVPATSGTSGACGTPPADNTKTHSWVTPAIPAGTTLRLNGTGGMTTYLESTSGADVNAQVCVGLYVVPGGLLGSLTGSLLAQPIGAAAQASVVALAGVPTPVSFNFDVGSAASVTATPANLARIEVVVWLAASANTSISMGYDQADLASQVTLMTT